MSPLSVTLGLADAARHRVAVSTLPALVRIATGPGADLVAVSGRGRDWPASVAAAIGSGARGVLVAGPGPADVDAVRGLQETAASSGAVVAVESPVFDATWLTAVERMRATVPEAAVVDGLLVTGQGLAGGFLEQLMLVGSLAGALDDVRGGSADGSYWISATIAGTPVNLAGVASPVRPRLTLHVVSEREQWEASFDRSAPARPTRIAHYDHNGAQLSPERYESAERAVWRHIATAVTEGAPLPYTLDDLADHLEPLARLDHALAIP